VIAAAERYRARSNQLAILKFPQSTTTATTSNKSIRLSWGFVFCLVLLRFHGVTSPLATVLITPAREKVGGVDSHRLLSLITMKKTNEKDPYLKACPGVYMFTIPTRTFCR